MASEPIDLHPASAPPRGLAVADDPTVVRVEHVTRSFGDRRVLDGVSFDLRLGEFVALLGRSGSGKSTLLRALADLDGENGGRIVVPELRAVVFQDPRLLPWARVIDNVVLGLKVRDAAERGISALAEVDLESHARDWPKTLSGGEANEPHSHARSSASPRSCCSTSPSERSTR
jgi:sulfonate transport system ATP-binding protein